MSAVLTDRSGPSGDALPLPAIAPRMLPVLRALIGVSVALTGVHVLLLPFAFGLLLAAVAVNDQLTGRIGVPSGLTSRPVLAAGALLTWAAITALWALKPGDALLHPVLYGILGMAVVVLLGWLGRLPADDRKLLMWPLVIGWCVAVVFLAFEQQTAGLISRTVSLGLYQMTGIERFAGARSLFLIESGIQFNRNVAAVVMLLPAAWIAYTAIARSRPWAHWLPFALAGLLVLASTQSSTAVLAFIAAVAAYVLAWRWPAATVRGVRYSFAGLVLLALPLAQAPHALGLHDVGSIPFSFRERVLIWKWASDSALERPPVGIGMFGTQVLHANWLIGQPPDWRNGLTRPRAARHPHNGYLELWTELGLPGALLALVFGWELLRTIERFSLRVQPVLAAYAAACLSVLGTGWSLWQPWLMASLALGIAFTAWAATVADDFKY